MWTVFNKRWEINDFNQKIIADADISWVWKDYNEFISDTAKLYIETLPQDSYPSREEIIKFYNNTLNWFLKYLTSITGNENNPFLLEKTNKIFPNFVRNRDQLNDDLNNNKEKLINTVKKEWKKFYWDDLILFEEIKEEIKEYIKEKYITK